MECYSVDSVLRSATDYVDSNQEQYHSAILTGLEKCIYGEAANIKLRVKSIEIELVPSDWELAALLCERYYEEVGNVPKLILARELKDMVQRYGQDTIY